MFKTKKVEMIYARVWRYGWERVPYIGGETQIIKYCMSDDPAGVISRTANKKDIWIKVKKEWLSTSGFLPAVPRFAILEYINQAEYETDLAFGLWNKLPITYRPVRTWFKKNYKRIMQWNMAATCISVVGGFQWLRMSSVPGDIWSIVGSAMVVHSSVSLLWLAYGMHKKQHGNR